LWCTFVIIKVDTFDPIKHSNMKENPYNAATVAARLTGTLEAMRNIAYQNGELQQAKYFNEVLLNAYEDACWSESSKRWLDDYKHEAIRIHEAIRTQTNP